MVEASTMALPQVLHAAQIGLPGVLQHQILPILVGLLHLDALIQRLPQVLVLFDELLLDLVLLLVSVDYAVTKLVLEVVRLEATLVARMRMVSLAAPIARHNLRSWLIRVSL